MSTREALLEVTARLFAEHGWRGTTTRRIAEEADVNEVTIFRNFGSKESLLLAAVRGEAETIRPPRLPEEPADLKAELVAWTVARHRRMHDHRAMIRTCLAEFTEHPELGPVACEHARSAIDEVVRYLEVARARGLIPDDSALEPATVLLMNAVFVDAITRDVFADNCHEAADRLIENFVDLVLAGLGATDR